MKIFHCLHIKGFGPLIYIYISMIRSESGDEEDLLEETLIVQKVKSVPSLTSNHLHNPFQKPPGPSQFAKINLEEEEKEKWKSSSTYKKEESTDWTEKSPFAQQSSKPSDSSGGLDKYLVPSVPFPYVLEKTKELDEGLLQIDQQIEALPCEIEKLTIMMPKIPTGIKTLVLGLDGLLIAEKMADQSNGFHNETYGKSKQRKDFNFIVPRPHLQTFLEKLVQKFEIILFSAASPEYTNKIAKKLDPNGKFFTNILNENQCISRGNKYFLKDLRIFKGRDLKDIVIIDNEVFNFSSQIDNGIYVPTFKGEEDDQELLKLLDFLLTLEGVNDVRPLVKKFSGIGRLRKMSGYAIDAEEAIDDESEVGEEYD